MIEAAMQTDVIKSFACGKAATEHGRPIVEVVINPPLTEDCKSETFALYRSNQPMNSDALLQLFFSAQDANKWAVRASYTDPPNSPDDNTGGEEFEHATYYCHIIGVRVTRTTKGWVATHESF